jgi:uncharacterized membrane protein
LLPHPNLQSRIEAIDLVRVLAMALMIEGHTLDALLAPSYQAAGWYHLWVFGRGFTAPTFMMLSGFSFALATIKRWDRHLSLNSVVLRRVRRFAFFIVLGYAMHLPVSSLREVGILSPEAWRNWLQVDVLQCIGMSLLLLQLLVWIARTPARFARLSLTLALALVAFAPAIWASGWSSYLPLGISAYVDGSVGSLFPLLPWAAYLLLGAGLGWLYVQSYRPESSTFAVFLLVSGAVAIVGGQALEKPAMAFFGEQIFWSTSPTLFLVRAGFVVVLLGGMFLVRRFVAFSSGTVRSLAQESLSVYFLHVCLLYGSIWNSGLRNRFSPLDLVQALTVAGLMIAAMALVALGWNRLKKGPPIPVLAFRTAVVAVAVFSIL